MRQTLWIFQKDLRHLWPQAAAALLLTALIAWLESSVITPGHYVELVEMVWVLSWLYFGASLIHEERLPGDRQFWLTRPYDWRCLLAAKLLFFTVFAGLPIFAARAISLGVNAASPLKHVPLLLASTATFAGVAALAGAAISAVTEKLLHVVWASLALVGIVAAGLLLTPDRNAGVPFLFIAAAGIPVLFVQYALRRTLLARAILAAGAFLVTVLPPLASAWNLHSRFEPQDAAAVRLSFDSVPRPRMRSADAPYFPKSHEEGLYLPIRIGDVPPGSAVLTDRVAVTVTAGARSWRSRWAGNIIAAGSSDDIHLIRTAGAAWVYLNVDRDFYQSVNDTPARLQISVFTTLLGERHTEPIAARGRTLRLAGDGLCQVGESAAFSAALPNMRNFDVACAWPRPAPARVYIRATSVTGQSLESLVTPGSVALFGEGGSAWDRGFTVFSARHGQISMTLETWRAEARLQRDVEIPQIRLPDYRAPRATDPE